MEMSPLALSDDGQLAGLPHPCVVLTFGPGSIGAGGADGVGGADGAGGAKGVGGAGGAGFGQGPNPLGAPVTYWPATYPDRAFNQVTPSTLVSQLRSSDVPFGNTVSTGASTPGASCTRRPNPLVDTRAPEFSVPCAANTSSGSRYPAAVTARAVPQIGRASCRDREQIAAAALSLKKK